ncbi:MAG: thioredoxin [Bryobacteraceae bacterium]|nr:thioredoxin [Bryobacteraceae bacterium]
MAGQNTLNFTDSAFETEVIASDKPVLVDFWAEWCGPCRMLGPTVDAVADEYQGKVKVGKMNVDENMSTPSRYGIRGIPALLLFKGGKPVGQIVGAVPKGEITKLLDQHVTA